MTAGQEAQNQIPETKAAKWNHNISIIYIGAVSAHSNPFINHVTVWKTYSSAYFIPNTLHIEQVSYRNNTKRTAELQSHRALVTHKPQRKHTRHVTLALTVLDSSSALDSVIHLIWAHTNPCFYWTHSSNSKMTIYTSVTWFNHGFIFSCVVIFSKTHRDLQSCLTLLYTVIHICNLIFLHLLINSSLCNRF